MVLDFGLGVGGGSGLDARELGFARRVKGNFRRNQNRGSHFRLSPHCIATKAKRKLQQCRPYKRHTEVQWKQIFWLPLKHMEVPRHLPPHEMIRQMELLSGKINSWSPCFGKDQNHRILDLFLIQGRRFRQSGAYIQKNTGTQQSIFHTSSDESHGTVLFGPKPELNPKA